MVHTKLPSSIVASVANLRCIYLNQFRETYKQVLKENCKNKHKCNPHQVGGSHICNFIFIITQVKHSIKVKVCKWHCHRFDKSACRGCKRSALEGNAKEIVICNTNFQFISIPFVMAWQTTCRKPVQML